MLLRQLAHGTDAEQRHRPAHLAPEDVHRPLDAFLATGHEPVEVGTPHHDAVGPEGEGSDDVGARHDAGVEQNLRLVAERRPDLGEDAQGHRGTVELATTMVREHDRVGAGVHDALRVGLVNRVVSSDTLIHEARALAERLASGPSFALGMTKALLNHELDIDFAAAIEAEAQAQAICMVTNDFTRAYEALADKRRPEFKGD